MKPKTVPTARKPQRRQYGNVEVTFSQMRINAHVSRCSRQAFVFPVPDVLLRQRVDIFFGEAKVDDMYEAVLLARRTTDEEILGLHVAVDDVLGMNVLQSRYLETKAKQDSVVNSLMHNVSNTPVSAIQRQTPVERKFTVSK